MDKARFRVTPLMAVSRSGSFSSTSRAFSPNSSTIRRAVAMPMPLTAPEAR